MCEATKYLGGIGDAAPFVMSIALVLDALAAASTALLFREALRGPDVSIGSMQRTAVVLLFVTLLVLAASMALLAGILTGVVAPRLGAAASLALGLAVALLALYQYRGAVRPRAQRTARFPDDAAAISDSPLRFP